MVLCETGWLNKNIKQGFLHRYRYRYRSITGFKYVQEQNKIMLNPRQMLDVIQDEKKPLNLTLFDI